MFVYRKTEESQGIQNIHLLLIQTSLKSVFLNTVIINTQIGFQWKWKINALQQSDKKSNLPLATYCTDVARVGKMELKQTEGPVADDCTSTSKP